MPKCAYCNSNDHTIETCKECKIGYDRFEHFAEKYLYVFLILLIVPIFILCVLMIFVDVLICSGLMLAIMGATIAVFPFCTPETFNALRILGTIRLARVLGTVIAVCGLLMVCASAFGTILLIVTTVVITIASVTSIILVLKKCK